MPIKQPFKEHVYLASWFIPPCFRHFAGSVASVGAMALLGRTPGQQAPGPHGERVFTQQGPRRSPSGMRGLTVLWSSELAVPRFQLGQERGFLSGVSWRWGPGDTEDQRLNGGRGACGHERVRSGPRSRTAGQVALGTPCRPGRAWRNPERRAWAAPPAPAWWLGGRGQLLGVQGYSPPRLGKALVGRRVRHIPSQ